MGRASAWGRFLRLHVCVVVGLVAAAFISGVAAALAIAGSTRPMGATFRPSSWTGTSLERIVEGVHDKGYSQVHAEYSSTVTINNNESEDENDDVDFQKRGAGALLEDRERYLQDIGDDDSASAGGDSSDPELLLLSGDNLHVKRVSELEFRAYEPVDSDGHASIDAMGRSASEVERCPGGNRQDSKSQIKLLIAITSTCCSLGSMRKREAIRQTWLKDAMLNFSDVIGYKFVLSTPDIAREDYESTRGLLREELRNGHDDILLLNDALERYENLPQKTIELLRYMGVSECGYTHVLKTDDDVYVRTAGILSMIGYQHANWHVASETLDSEQLTGVYRGYIELKSGFRPVRDRHSKWYLSREEWPDGVEPVEYAAGWGYVLSKDMGDYVVEKMDYYKSIADDPDTHKNTKLFHGQTHPDLPVYYKGMLKLEDVMIGYVLHEIGVTPLITYAFKAAWMGCNNYTILKHLDVDAPFLMALMSIQDRSGIWRDRTIQCNSGRYSTGSYSKWLQHSQTTKAGRVAVLEDADAATFDVEYEVYYMKDCTR